jgi:hypothetical protein
VVVVRQLALTLEEQAAGGEVSEMVLSQLPEESLDAAVAQCARLVAQAALPNEDGDGEGDEQPE